MSKLAVLIGQSGSDPAEIPCLVFSSLEKGMEHCKKLFGFEPEELREGEDDHIVGWRWAILANDDDWHDYSEDSNSVINKIAAKLYRDYEPCGVFAFDLREVKEGKPFVCWID